MFNVGLIRVITLDEAQGLNTHGQLIESLYPDIAVESVCIPNQPEGIHSPEQTDEAIPKIVQVARECFANKDMILVSCAEDPGVEEIRAAMPGMPVTGGGGHGRLRRLGSRPSAATQLTNKKAGDTSKCRPLSQQFR